MANKMKTTKNNKKHDERFQKVNIKHDPQAESARAAFRKNEKDGID